MLKVEHLRKNNLGRASFLPITSVKGRKLDKIKGHEKLCENCGKNTWKNVPLRRKPPTSPPFST